MMNRRTFVGAMGLVGSACALGFGGTLLAKRRLSPPELGSATLLPMQGQRVTLKAQETGRVFSAEVVDVGSVRYAAAQGAPGTEQVSLLLKTDLKEPVGGLHLIETKDLSLGSLFLSPVGEPGRHGRLEAVITRIA